MAAASYRYDQVKRMFRHCYLMLTSNEASLARAYPTALSRILALTPDFAERVNAVGGTVALFRDAQAVKRIDPGQVFVGSINIDADDSDDYVGASSSMEI